MAHMWNTVRHYVNVQHDPVRAEHPAHILKTLPFEVQRLLFVAWVSQWMYKVTSIGSHAAPSCHLLLHVFAKFIPNARVSRARRGVVSQFTYKFLNGKHLFHRLIENTSLDGVISLTPRPFLPNANPKVILWTSWIILFHYSVGFPIREASFKNA